MRGKTENVIHRQLQDGTTIMTRAQAEKNSRQKKRAKERRSTAQKEHNRRFREAARYAGAAAKAQPVYAERAALMPMWTAYNHALYDWFHAPAIACLAQHFVSYLGDCEACP